MLERESKADGCGSLWLHMTQALRSYAAFLERTGANSPVRVFGLDSAERLRRSFARSGLDLVSLDDIEGLADARVVALDPLHFYDERLIPALAGREEDLLLLAEAGATVAVGVAGRASAIADVVREMWGVGDPCGAAKSAGIAIRAAADLVPAYDDRLRKRSQPFILPADPVRASEIERRIFDASYKGATDFVTKWVWPAPARVVTGWCARVGVSPNAITLLGYVLTLAALIAFGRGAYGPGLVCAWGMTFLDTVDGKLARVTLTSSRIGDILDHGLDLVHPPFWWAAWGVGLVAGDGIEGEHRLAAAVIVGGYVVGRLLEGLFIVAFGREMFTWRPFDEAFRLVIARRNPNLVLLTLATLAGRPDLGFFAVAIWTLVCIAIQIIRIGQAAFDRMRGRAIVPFEGPAVAEAHREGVAPPLS